MVPPAHVLIVDDERDLVRLLEFNLQQAGFETAVAYAGEDALQKVRQRIPDLIVLDLMLPDIPGNEVCRQLKADPATRPIRVIVLTANALVEDCERAMAAGCDDFDTKPVELPRLLTKIDELLKKFPPKPVA